MTPDDAAAMTTADRTPTDTVAGLPARLGEVVRHWARRAPRQAAIIDGTRTWTYADLERGIAAARTWLERLGVRAGDRVMMVAENGVAAIALFFAVTDLDAWAVIVNARLADREIDDIQRHSGARRTIYTVAASAPARGHAERHGAVTEEVAGLGPLAASPLNAAAVPEPVDTDGARQVAALIYTTGTTGAPKAVMLSHRNILFMAKVSGEVRGLGPGDGFYAVLPMSHIVGLSVVVVGTLFHGAALYLCPRFSPGQVLAALARQEITVLLGVPAMYSLLVEDAKTKGIERATLRSLRIIGSCGAPLDAAIKSATERLFGLALHNGYGITECSPTIAQTRIEAPRADCSVGRLLPGVESRLVGADANPVAAGAIGELHVRGPNVMLGYYGAPLETAAAIDADGWFNTRDLARFEDDYLFIVGRSKELIIRFGFNVYPPEVEAALNDHPAVVQSAVVGCTVGGDEEIVAFVQVATGMTVSEAALADHAAARLAAYKRPTRIVLTDALPAGTSGKVLKSELAQRATELLAAEHRS